MAQFADFIFPVHFYVKVDRKDEIGKLGHTIEEMRQKLVQKDETERTLLQNISHDLKTPVMVIRGLLHKLLAHLFDGMAQFADFIFPVHFYWVIPILFRNPFDVFFK